VGTDIDVIVAGAGGAGLTAAIRAAEQGASVAVLEWRERFQHSNNTSMSTAMIPAAGSRWQAGADVDDDPDLFLADILAKTDGTADRTIARALVDVAPEMVAWLADGCDIPLSLVTDFVYPGHSRPRCHTVPGRSGASLLEGLIAATRRHELVNIITPLRITGVHHDGARREVSVVAAYPDGSEERLTAGALILATGGFGANPELVKQHIPEIADGAYYGGDGCMGDALSIGRSLDLDIGYLDAYQGHGSLAKPQNVLVTWATVMHGAIVVNIDGRRFGDETVGYSEYARKVLDQPGGEAWILLDRRIDAACRSFKDYQDLLDQGGVRWADDVASLVAATGMDADGLADTLALHAAISAGTTTDPFGRDDRPDPLDFPLGWVRVTGALFHTQGGLMVDEVARVTRGGTPVDGVYASGGAAAGISGHGPGGYMAGNGLLAALGLGYLAGGHAGALAASRTGSGS
jgi:fumarate reductase flavoprotein subunit